MLLKCNAESAQAMQDFEGNLCLQFAVSPENRYAVRKAMQELKGKKLTLTIDKYREKRSLRQNNLLWALMEIMSRTQGQDPWDCYMDMLEAANAKYEYIECLKEALPSLKEMFRTIRVIEERKSGKTVLCKCFWGSSKFNTSEMKMLIDKAFDRLAELGIDAKDQAEISWLWQEWSR